MVDFAVIAGVCCWLGTMSTWLLELADFGVLLIVFLLVLSGAVVLQVALGTGLVGLLAADFTFADGFHAGESVLGLWSAVESGVFLRRRIKMNCYLKDSLLSWAR